MTLAFRLFIISLLLSSVGLLSAVASAATGTVQIDQPAAHAVLSGLIQVRGSALLPNSTLANFRYYRLEYNHVDDVNHSSTVTGEKVQEAQINDGLLDMWDTTQVPNGTYVIRLQIYGNRGMITETTTTVTVSNDLPSLEPEGRQSAFLELVPPG